MKQALTQKEVRVFLRSASDKQERFDGHVPGFGVRANGKGGGSWVLLYVIPGRADSKRRRYVIGAVADMSVRDARGKAAIMKANVHRGIDVAVDARRNPWHRRVRQALGTMLYRLAIYVR